MKVNLKLTIKDEHGNEAKVNEYDIDKDGKPFVKESRPYLLGEAMKNAVNKIDPEATPVEQYTRGGIVAMINAADVNIDLNEDQRILIKSLACKCGLPPYTVYQIHKALENE